MKKLVAILLVGMLWFGVGGVVHINEVVKASSTTIDPGGTQPEYDPFWDDDGGTATP